MLQPPFGHCSSLKSLTPPFRVIATPSFLRARGWLLKLDINTSAAPVFALCAELRVCIWELDSCWLPTCTYPGIRLSPLSRAGRKMTVRQLQLELTIDNQTLTYRHHL